MPSIVKPVTKKRAFNEKQTQINGLYVHSSPPRVLLPNSAQVKHLIKSGDVEKLEQLVIDGQGKQLLGEYSADYKTRTFLRKVPALMSKLSLLHDAVNSGRLEELQYLLEEETPEKRKKMVLSKDDSGVGLLHKAIYYDLKDIYKFLIEKFPQTVSLKDSEGRTAYHYTAMCKNPSLVQKMLLNAGADTSALDSRQHSAKYYMHHSQELELPSAMKKHGAQPGKGVYRHESLNIKKSNIRIWIHQRNLANLQQVVWEGHGPKLLVEHSNNPKVKKFLDSVPHIMGLVKGIHSDVLSDDLEGLKRRLEPPVPSVVLSGKDVNGLTALHKAAGLGKQEIAEFIIEKYPNCINMIDSEGRTPLHYAASLKDNGNMMNFLLDKGADESCLDNRQKTALYYKNRPSDLDTKVLNVIPDCPRAAKDPNVASIEWQTLNTSASSEELQKVKEESTKKVLENGHREVKPTIPEEVPQDVPEPLPNGIKDEIETKAEEKEMRTEEVDEVKSKSAKLSRSSSRKALSKAASLEKEGEEKVETTQKPLSKNPSREQLIEKPSAEDTVKSRPSTKSAKTLSKSSSKNELIENPHDEAPNEESPSEENIPQTRPVTRSEKSLSKHSSKGDLDLDKNESQTRPATKSGKTDPSGHNSRANSSKNPLLKQATPPPTKEEVIEGLVQEDDEKLVQEGVSHSTEVDSLVDTGNMEQLASLVLNGDGGKLIGKKSSNPELQSFLDNVQTYMDKINRIHIAARAGSLRDLQAALDRRKFAIAKDQMSPNGASPLHVAVIFGNTSIVRYLAGRFPETAEVTDDHGRTPLHYAAVLPDNGHYYNLLVHLGADTRIQDKFGKNAEFYRAHQENLSHKQLLNDFGADESVSAEILSDKEQAPSNGQEVDMPFFATEEGRYLASSLGDPLIKGLTEVANKRPEDPIAYLATYLYNFANTRERRVKTQESLGQGKEMPPETIEVVTVEPEDNGLEEDSAFNNTSRDEHGQSMLHFAAARAHGRNSLFQLLMETDLNVAYRDELYRTARDISIQANIPENTQEIDRYVMQIATKGDTDKLVELLLDGYDHITDIVDENNVPIMEAVNQQNQPDTVSFLQSILTFEEKRERVHHAIRLGSINDIRLLLADENDTGSGKLLAIGKNNYARCSLHIAVLCQQEEIVDFVANTFPDTLKLGDNLERTALHYAMGVEKMETISKVLIKAGAKRIIKDLKGRQPTYYYLNKSDILRLQEEEETF